jgi:hypothetical protein
MCRRSEPSQLEPARSFNYDNQGRRVNPQGGHYLIPADQFASVVARMQWDPRILNCFTFVPRTTPAPSCPCTAPRAQLAPRSSFVRRQ